MRTDQLGYVSLKDEEDKPVVSDKDLQQMVSGCGNVRSRSRQQIVTCEVY